MTDLKTSLLVNRQVPEYVREEYPLFISFLEAYYEFLENAQGVTSVSKKIRDLSDVDSSINDFEENFFRTYADLIPKQTEVNKEILIKNILPLYLAKGSEKSFKFLFRLLFGQELEVSYPKNEILRASDGKWQIENVLKISSEIYSYYDGDGSTKEFKLLKESDATELTVYIDGVLQSSNYEIRKEYKKIIFDDAPSDSSLIEILYDSIEPAIFNSRQLTGQSSGATVIVEEAFSKLLNNVSIIELYVNSKSLSGTFIQTENVLCSAFVDGTLVNFKSKSISILNTITLISGGSSYNVGDPVSINTLSYNRLPSAIISKVFSGGINRIIVNDGGAGFTLASNVNIEGVSNTELELSVSEVNTNGRTTPNTFVIFSNIISELDIANVSLNVADWGISGNSLGYSNIDSVISESLGTITYTNLGEVSNLAILVANAVFSVVPPIDVVPAKITIEATGSSPANVDLSILSFGSLGKLIITRPGVDYEIGDELIFTNKPMSFGKGAAAEVTEIGPSGEIRKVSFVPSKITGTANITNGSIEVSGNNTSFETELFVGDEIMIYGQSRNVVTIDSNTALNVDAAFVATKFEQPVRLWGKNLLGGQNYENDKLPTITISSTLGSNADIVVTTIMGDGEDIEALGTRKPGEIEEITIVDRGEDILLNPIIDLSSYGDGTATANAQLTLIYETLIGRWTTTDSLLSSSDRKLQGRNYYNDYSYLLTSSIEFSKYKNTFKQLLHPAGFKEYAQYKLQDEINSSSLIVSTLTSNNIIDLRDVETISGRVNIANASIFVTGIGTKFNVANDLFIISVGSYIAINSEIRVVNSIISNTNLEVTSAFTISANLEEMYIINTGYSFVATEASKELTTETNLSILVE